MPPPNPLAARERFIERLKLCIQRVGSLSKLAEQSGIPPSTLKHYMSDGDPSRASLWKIAEGAGVSAAWLLTGEGYID